MAGINAYDRLEYSRLDLPTLQERMIAPMYLQEQHDRAEEQLNATLSEAEKARMAAFQDPNSNAARVYQDYTTRLQQATDQLARNGIRGAGVKAAIGKIRADYNKDIAPILGAWEQQKKDIAALNELKAKDRTLIFADDPNQRQIDAYISRGNASYIPQGISGQQIASQVAAAAKPYSDWISQTRPEVMGSGVPYKYFTMVQKGFSPQDVAAAMVTDGFTPEQATEGTMILRSIRDNVIGASGAYELFRNNPEAINQITQYANQGLSQAIGTRQFGTMADTYNEGLAQFMAKARMKGPDAELSFNARGYPYVKVGDTSEGKRIDSALSALKETISKELPKGSVEDLEKLAFGLNNTILGEAMRSGAGHKGQRYISSDNNMRKKLSDLYEAIDFMKSHNIEDTSQLKDALNEERKAIAQKYTFYSPNLTSSKNLSNVILGYVATNPEDTFERIDNDYSTETKFLSNKPKTLGAKDAQEFFNDDTKYQYAPGFGIIATSGSDPSKKVRINPSSLGPHFMELYEEATNSINRLLTEKPEGYGDLVSKIAMALVNSIGNEQATLRQIQGVTSTKNI